MNDTQACVAGCAACCIAPAISSAIPGMPQGKPAGVRCIQLDNDGLCKLFDLPERPRVCVDFKPTQSLCGAGAEQALVILQQWELQTRP